MRECTPKITRDSQRQDANPLLRVDSLASNVDKFPFLNWLLVPRPRDYALGTSHSSASPRGDPFDLVHAAATTRIRPRPLRVDALGSGCLARDGGHVRGAALTPPPHLARPFTGFLKCLTPLAHIPSSSLPLAYGSRLPQRGYSRSRRVRHFTHPKSATGGRDVRGLVPRTR